MSPTGSETVLVHRSRRDDVEGAVVSGSIWTMLHVAMSTPIALVVNAIVARVLGPAEYGKLALITMVVAIAGQVSNFSVSEGVIQWGAAAHARGDKAFVDRLLRASLGYHLVVQLPLLVIVVTLLGAGAGPLVLGALVLSVALPAALGSAALSISIENKTAAAARLAIAANLAAQAAIAATAMLTQAPVSVWASRSAAGSLLVPLNFLLLDRARRRVALSPQLPRRMPPGFWRFCAFGTAGGLTTGLVLTRSETLVLGRYGQTATLGVFALAFGLAQQVTAPIDAVTAPLAPAVAGVMERRPDLAGETFLRITRVSSLMAALLIVGAFPIVQSAIPVVYGSDFAAAAWAFLVLGIASCTQTVATPAMTFARTRRRTARILVVSVIALVADAGLAVALIPPLGLVGAVTANVAGFGTLFGALIVMELRAGRVRLRSYLGAACPLLLGGTAMAGSLAIPLTDLSWWAEGTTHSAAAYAILALLVRLTGAAPGQRDAMGSVFENVSARAAWPLRLTLAPLLGTLQRASVHSPSDAPGDSSVH